MALFWACRTLKSGIGPLKVQGQKIKNKGTQPIYVFDIEDDAILSPQCMHTFSQACIMPGVEMDLTAHPFVNCSSVSNPDLDICLHCDGDIDVSIISSDVCDRWTSDRNHPWNGAPMPNGQYTRYFQRPMGVPPGLPAGMPVGNLGMPVISGGLSSNNPLPAGNNKLTASPSAQVPGGINWKHLEGIDSIPLNITINDEPKQCTCPSLDLFRNGCKCGAVSKKKWGLQ